MLEFVVIFCVYIPFVHLIFLLNLSLALIRDV